MGKMFDKADGLPCGTPFRRLTSFPLRVSATRNSLRINRKVVGHFTFFDKSGSAASNGLLRQRRFSGCIRIIVSFVNVPQGFTTAWRGFFCWVEIQKPFTLKSFSNLSIITVRLVEAVCRLLLGFPRVGNFRLLLGIST
jgi:hypothetical protein